MTWIFVSKVPGPKDVVADLVVAPLVGVYLRLPQPLRCLGEGQEAEEYHRHHLGAEVSCQKSGATIPTYHSSQHRCPLHLDEELQLILIALPSHEGR